MSVYECICVVCMSSMCVVCMYGLCGVWLVLMVCVDMVCGGVMIMEC
jgi:hypothetical protein